MKRPPHDSSQFGERERQELRVDPKLGRADTQFHFKAFHFERRKMVKVVIEGPKNFVVFDSLLITDDDGSIGRDRLILTASRDWPLGVYTFSVDGLSETFVLTR